MWSATWDDWPTKNIPTLTMAVAASKAALRKDILHKVASISTEERSRQSEIIQNAVISSKSFKEAKHISVYLSLPKEVSTKRIVDAILAGTYYRATILTCL